jgi:hypothetical protein
MKSTRAASVLRRPPTLRAIGRKADAILSEALPQLDRTGLNRLQRQHDAELRRLAGEAKRRTIKGGAAAWRHIKGLVAGQRAALDALPVDPFGPNSELLLKVDFIRSWPTPQNLRDSHQAPGVNWAKYAFKSGSQNLGHFHEKVSFYNVWQNPRDVAVLVDVLVRLTAYGHVSCSAEGGGVSSWFGWAGEYRSSVDVSARLSLWGLWTEPAPIYVVDDIPLGGCSATAGFFSDSDSTSIGSDGNGVAPALAATAFAVPPGASILIEASLAVDYKITHGAVDVDFASNNLFNVGWAYATVTLPPDMMANG